MPQGRIIYIKNPSSGSHFRNLGGSRSSGGSSGPRPPRPPRPPKTPSGPPEPTDNSDYGYMPGPGPAPSDWATPDYEDDPYGNFGTPTPGLDGVGPYEQEFSLTPAEAAYLYSQDTSFGIQMYNLLVHGIDPSGLASALLPYGTPGTLEPFYEMKMGAYETWRGPHDDRFGNVSGGMSGPQSGIDPKFLNVKPPKKKKKKKANFFNPTGQ